MPLAQQIATLPRPSTLIGTCCLKKTCRILQHMAYTVTNLPMATTSCLQFLSAPAEKTYVAQHAEQMSVFFTPCVTYWFEAAELSALLAEQSPLLHSSTCNNPHLKTGMCERLASERNGTERAAYSLPVQFLCISKWAPVQWLFNRLKVGSSYCNV